MADIFMAVLTPFLAYGVTSFLYVEMLIMLRLACLMSTLFSFIYLGKKKTDTLPDRIVVLTGGDLSKSPRIQCHLDSILGHTKSFAPMIKPYIHILAYEKSTRCMDGIEKAMQCDRIHVFLFSEWRACTFMLSAIRSFWKVMSIFIKQNHYLPRCNIPHRLKQSKKVFNILFSRLIGSLKRKILFPILRLCWLIDVLFIDQCLISSDTCIFVQNPPAIPLLPFVKIIRWWFQCRLIIDWHNIGTTLLKYSEFENDRLHRSLQHFIIAKRNKQNPLPRISIHFDIILFLYLCVELYCGNGDWNILVSNRMRLFLVDLYSLSVFDRLHYALYMASDSDLRVSQKFISCSGMKEPSPAFVVFRDHPLHSKVAHLQKCIDSHRERNESDESCLDFLAESLQMNRNFSDIFIVIMSCSWSNDDDIDFFYKMLEILYTSEANERVHKKCHFIVTGTGPRHSYFLEKINNSSIPALKRQEHHHSAQHASAFYISEGLSSIYFNTYDTYMEAINRCHIGISVHRSSSMLDLPMKIIEYFTCGIPTLALYYPGIEEALRDDKQSSMQFGWSAKNPAEMAAQIRRSIQSYVCSNDAHYSKVVENVRNAYSNKANCWEERWNSTIAPLFGFSKKILCTNMHGFCVF